MLVVGLTGGIGSGKSAVAAELAHLGIAVIDADAVARRCVGAGTPALAAIVARFGREVLRDGGELDRARLAEIVFSDASARRDLEAITHPCIREGIDADLAALSAGAPPPAVVVIEHPLLVETGSHERVDRVVVVETPVEQRVARLVAGRGMDESDARARIAAQTDDVTRRRVADHLIVNDGDLAGLRELARGLVAQLTSAGDG